MGLPTYPAMATGLIRPAKAIHLRPATAAGHTSQATAIPRAMAISRTTPALAVTAMHPVIITTVTVALTARPKPGMFFPKRKSLANFPKLNTENSLKTETETCGIPMLMIPQSPTLFQGPPGILRPRKFRPCKESG